MSFVLAPSGPEESCVAVAEGAPEPRPGTCCPLEARKEKQRGKVPSKLLAFLTALLFHVFFAAFSVRQASSPFRSSAVTET